MIRKSIYSFLVLVLIYFGFAYLVAIGSIGNYEGPGKISISSTPDEILNKRTQQQLDAVSYTHLTLPTNREV